MLKSGYVLAGFETLIGIINNFCLNVKGRYTDNFTRQEISDYFDKIMSGFLHSYGDNFSSKNKYSTYSRREANVYTKCKNTKLCGNVPLIIDSGGFQIANGRLNLEKSKMLLKLYYDEFVMKHHDSIDKAFILDIPPGTSCEIFSDFDDIYRWNHQSYSKAAALPDEIRKKIIYIHHFRSPKLWETFDKLLKENNFFERFDLFATGGVVGGMRGDSDIPCIIYILPLIPLLNEAIKNKRKKLDFHILGGANYRDVLFYETFRLHILKIHGIEVIFTYDSSGLYKGLMVGRFITILDENKIVHKLDLRSNLLDLRFKSSKYTVREEYSNQINAFAHRHNFKQIDTTNIYGDETFNEEIKVYTMLFMLEMYSTMQIHLRNEVERIYPMFESGNLDSYSFENEKIVLGLNGLKLSKKQKVKSNSIINSLNMLTNLDEDYCKHIVNKFLSKDEFVNLITDDKILTI